jgi:hypothetical protein
MKLKLNYIITVLGCMHARIIYVCIVDILLFTIYNHLSGFE